MLNNKSFNKLSKEEQEKLTNNLIYDFLDKNMSCKEIVIKYNSNLTFIRKFFKDRNIKKDENLQNKRRSISVKISKSKVTKEEQEKINDKRKQTNLKKFGVENPWQSKDIQNKIKQECKEKYGVEYHNQRQDVKNKISQSTFNHYGGYKILQTEYGQILFKNTCQKKYGYSNPGQSPKIKEKINNTFMKKYGCHPTKLQCVKNKAKNTNLIKYGDENYNNLEQISKTCQERYNVKWSCQLPQCINKSNSISKINQIFANMLSKNNIKYEREYPLDDKKYDFKIGNILVEINPTYTHNSTIGCGFNGHYENPLDTNYHQQKSLLAQENGYFCIHIFDWDDWNKIINRFLSKQKIYARQCELKEIKNKKELNEFLNNYHLQNTCRAQKIKLGLYYDNKLIEVMTFGKPRYNKNYEWELLRLCTHKDYNVVGGSERLFKHFINNYNPSNIISYCDYSKFSGEVYERIGMKFKELTNPNCNWSKGKQKITNNLLMQRGADQLIGTDDGKGTSNKDIMIRENWKEVYDCGQKVFIWNK